MVSITMKCPECNSEMKVSISEKIMGERLAWSTSCNCSQCDYAEELDGRGELPTELRQHVVNEEGSWNLNLISLGNQVGKGLKALKETFQLNNAKVSEMRISLPNVITSSTRTEMKFYQQLVTRHQTKVRTIALWYRIMECQSSF